MADFVVQPLTEQDFVTMRKFVLSKDGTLAAPFADTIVPATDDETGAVRNNWSLDQQLDCFKLDETATFLKAVDTKTNEIAAIARWHKYPGTFTKYYDFEWAGAKDKADPASYPPGTSLQLLNLLCNDILDLRKDWQVSGPHWTLTTLKTRETQRRRGAGGLLVEWGVAKAKEDGVPAYLEAMPAGASLYRKKGFKVIREVNFDLKDLGISEPLPILCMAANVDGV